MAELPRRTVSFLDPEFAAAAEQMRHLPPDGAVDAALAEID